MEYYHAFTRGLEKDLLFYGDAEFLYGMNIIPRYLKLSGTRLLAFCLMDNHVHFVLEGCRAACNQFIINYKRTVFSFLKKCRERDIPETTVPGIVGIESTDSLLTVIAYVLRHPVAAGSCTHATADSCMHRTSDSCMPRKIEELPRRERKRCFIDGPEYPGHWTVDGNGMIYPENYTEVAKVEGLFRSVKRYLYYLSSAREAEVNLTMGHEIRLSDTELRREASAICLERFGTASVGLLTIAQKLQVCKLLRIRFGASYKQLGRVIHIDSDTIKEML